VQPVCQSRWEYGLADADGQLPAGAYRLRHSPTTGSEPIGAMHEMLSPTVVLLVRRAGRRDRVVYNLGPKDQPFWALVCHSCRSSPMTTVS